MKNRIISLVWFIAVFAVAAFIPSVSYLLSFICITCVVILTIYVLMKAIKKTKQKKY